MFQNTKPMLLLDIKIKVFAKGLAIAEEKDRKITEKEIACVTVAQIHYEFFIQCINPTNQ